MLTPDSSIEDIVLNAQLIDFLETTGLTQETPQDFRVTIPNGYERLLDHISTHRYYRGIEMGRPVSWDEAVKSWYESVYKPMISIIRKSGILEEFPENTETDLYLFIMDHLHRLRQLYGTDQAKPDQALREFQELSRENSQKAQGKFARWWNRHKK